MSIIELYILNISGHTLRMIRSSDLEAYEWAWLCSAVSRGGWCTRGMPGEWVGSYEVFEYASNITRRTVGDYLTHETIDDLSIKYKYCSSLRPQETFAKSCKVLAEKNTAFGPGNS